ncbi:MAG: hypothetical protein A2172_05095 [Candidatus Woykebacteria bacterium RBG_13_40_15]|uniref:Uncharacterized protein n=1 Tax=Candidatus Woykebacteria bacterium RBG_13_40_15 TaxID=1802593 RepID=A0A1G1W8D2_9BACT|nr:MAG: hypothetical protein A2172_05095 [Candidatus Woykebacteria bacterium RBG_13_40_15]
MKLLYALLCDNAFLSIDKKVNIIGVFETIGASKFPITHPKFVIVGSIAPDKRKFKMSLNIVSEKSKEAILGNLQEREVSLPEESKDQNFNFIIEVVNASFNEPGIYKVEISIDDKVVGEIPFKLVEGSLSSVGSPS